MLNVRCSEDDNNDNMGLQFKFIKECAIRGIRSYSNVSVDYPESVPK